MLASRTFTEADQIGFAAVSGDRNPMHLDALLARRTQAGVPVVHGVHLLLWGLDALARSEHALPPIRRLKAQFKHFVAVDERVAVAAARTEAGVILRLTAAGITVAQLVVDFGAAVQAAEAVPGEPVPVPAEARDLSFEATAGMSGKLAFASPPDAIAAMFPAAASRFGPRRLAALAATTLLVGMVCPGLHSIFAGLTVEACDEPVPEDRLSFRVTATDARVRSVRMAVAGGGVAGAVESYARLPPTSQASVQDLADLVEPGEFSGAVALVIGGSRGLGEVTAKLLAAGGARVAISYRVGVAEAEAVAQEIRSAGGECETLAYDASLPAEPQLAGLDAAPTHAYYFATPKIFGAQSSLFARARLDAFLSVYVEGFLNLAEALKARRRDVSLFYPSSVAVAERPRGMLEYAMAKAAGETLCVELNQALRPLHVTVNRLPRLLTDQTASVIGASAPAPAGHLLSVVRETQSWPLNALIESVPAGSLQISSAG
jgi:acyl dehydratase/NADP-dependent 3-hydroxy acid dehydrogenase YdfG